MKLSVLVDAKGTFAIVPNVKIIDEEKIICGEIYDRRLAELLCASFNRTFPDNSIREGLLK